jgi:hypothetical protein
MFSHLVYCPLLKKQRKRFIKKGFHAIHCAREDPPSEELPFYAVFVHKFHVFGCSAVKEIGFIHPQPVQFYHIVGFSPNPIEGLVIFFKFLGSYV